MSNFKVWHIPQVPGKAFEFETEDLTVARELMVQLALYDLFQLENRIKPDYCNTQGISMWSEEEQEWWDVDEDEMQELLAEGVQS